MCTCLQTGSIFVSLPAAALPAGAYPQYTQYNASYDVSGYPNHNNDVSGTADNYDFYSGKYAFYLNQIRSAVQNVTSPPNDDSDLEFACNPDNYGLSNLLLYLQAVQGIAGGPRTLPFSPPLITGPLPAGKIPQ